MSKQRVSSDIGDPQLWGGLAVFDAEGQQIGVARDQDNKPGYFILEEGHLFPHDVEVPLSMVTRTDATGIRLSIKMSEFKQKHWSDTPATVIPGAAGYAARNYMTDPRLQRLATKPGFSWLNGSATKDRQTVLSR